MAQITLTAAQQKMLAPLLDQTEAEQNAVATYQANLAAGQARRDVKHAEVKDSLTELGYAPPDPVTSVTKQLDASGAWTGTVLVNE